MGHNRIARGKGQDLPGQTVMSRNAQNMSFKTTKTERKAGGAPTEDTRIDPDKGEGSRVAHVGTSGAPTIYREKEGGRKGGRGKRV